jgi:hypothetical protein
MESPGKNIVLTRGLSLVILIGFIGIAASPFTQNSPMYPIYHIHEFEEDIVLNDDFPMFEFVYPFVDKIVIEKLITNGSPVIINLYDTYESRAIGATIQNVTELRDILLVGTSLEPSMSPVFRITRFNNQSVQFLITFCTWGSFPSTDNLSTGPSIFLILVIPLAYSIYKYWGNKLDKRGYAILILLILSAVFIAPVLVYSYNGGATLLRHDEIQITHTYGFMLNTSNPLREFNESIDSGGSDSFVRIANFTTSGVPVQITLSPDGVAIPLELENITVFSSSPLQIELPRENVTGFIIQFNWTGQNTSITFSIETVKDVWAPWIDPVPYYQSCVAGIALMVIVLVFPQKRIAQLSDETTSPT